MTKIKTIKEQVYEYLRQEIKNKNLKPGSAIDMAAICRQIGVSKSPLRDALVQLETEGFVTISPRKGITVNRLSLEEIKEYYQVIGALESSAFALAYETITESDINKLDKLNDEMAKALKGKNYDLYFSKNIKFHDIITHANQNLTMKKIINNLRHRLVDFQSKDIWIHEWEESSLKEHQHLVKLLKKGDIGAIVTFIREVHWSYEVQEKFIKKYYSDSE